MESKSETLNEQVQFAYELYKLSDEQKEELKDRIKKFDGLIRVFVHPLAVRADDKPIENHDRVLKILGRTLSSENAPPIIVLENSSRIEEWKESRGDKSSVAHDVYVVPTIRDYPYPLIDGKSEPSKDDSGCLRDEDFTYVEEGFKNFVEFLNSIGVKKVLVGGTSLEIREDHITRCVGIFIQFMKQYSDAELKMSLGTAPTNRTDIKAIHPELL